jgi:pseudouridine-5'-monophosphatase
MNTIKNNIKGVIFDLDGLLLDTEPIYLEAIGKTCLKYGKEYSIDIRVDVVGKDELLGAELIVNKLQIPLTAKEFLQERSKILEVLLPHAKPMKGAYKLCEHLYKNSIPMAVATSSVGDSVKLKLQNHQKWFSLFNGKIISGDHPSIKQAKPAPDIFLAAAKMIQVNSENCLVFEDSPSGVLAGKNAGMTVVSVPEPFLFKYKPENYKNADLILQSLEEFKPELFGLPPYE